MYTMFLSLVLAACRVCIRGSRYALVKFIFCINGQIKSPSLIYYTQKIECGLTKMVMQRILVRLQYNCAEDCSDIGWWGV